jgi:hypothetical protein
MSHTTIELAPRGLPLRRSHPISCVRRSPDPSRHGWRSRRPRRPRRLRRLRRLRRPQYGRSSGLPTNSRRVTGSVQSGARTDRSDSARGFYRLGVRFLGRPQHVPAGDIPAEIHGCPRRVGLAHRSRWFITLCGGEWLVADPGLRCRKRRSLPWRRRSHSGSRLSWEPNPACRDVVFGRRLLQTVWCKPSRPRRNERVDDVLLSECIRMVVEPAEVLAEGV